MKTIVENRLAQVRKSRGVGASELARRVHVSRQTIYAIEAGAYVPNTEVALHLARELEVTVDELFSLPAGPPPSPESIAADVLSADPAAAGQPVRICQMEGSFVCVPVTPSPYYMPEADGMIERVKKAGRADMVVFAREETAQKRLVLAGCDPAMGLLARMVEKAGGVEIVPAAASSRLALRWLKEGKVHIAGSHLEDPKTGEFNLPFIRREFANEDMIVVTLARWEEGLVTAAGNQKRVNRVEDLARADVRFVNREQGSGSRALLDRLLAGAGVEGRKVQGYERIAHGHLAAAYRVASGEADACLATLSAARAFGLGFIPLHSERYDLVMRKRTAEIPAVEVFLDVMQRAALRRKLEMLAGYDTAETGAVVYGA